MKNSKPEDKVFVMCASVTVLAAATALAGLVFQLATVAAPLVESVISRSQGVLMLTRF